LLLLGPGNLIFSVDIDKNLTVDNLRMKIKKKMEDVKKGPHYELDLWQVSLQFCREIMRSLRSKLKPPIPSSEFGVLQSIQRPGDMGIKLDPFFNLEQYFSSPPREHIHVIVVQPSHW
jgi:hypothetical protein